MDAVDFGIASYSSINTFVNEMESIIFIIFTLLECQYFQLTVQVAPVIVILSNEIITHVLVYKGNVT